jgi:hypothetical protein
MVPADAFGIRYPNGIGIPGYFVLCDAPSCAYSSASHRRCDNQFSSANTPNSDVKTIPVQKKVSLLLVGDALIAQ